MKHLRESILGANAAADMMAPVERMSEVMNFIKDVHKFVMDHFNKYGITEVSYSTSERDAWDHVFYQFNLTPMSSVESKQIYYRARQDLYIEMLKLVKEFNNSHKNLGTKLVLFERYGSIRIYNDVFDGGSMLYVINAPTTRPKPYIRMRKF